METGQEISIIMIDDKNNLFGQADYTRFNNAKWYQKLWAKISPKYKRSLIDIKPLECTYKGDGSYDINL